MSSLTAAETAARPTMQRALMLVDGQWVAAANGRFLEIENPANRTIIAEVPSGNAEDVDRAVRAAARAFESWKTVAPRERGKLLLKIADALEAKSDAIPRLLAIETGNAICTQSRPEVRIAADVFRYFGGVASELKGETVPLGEHVLVHRGRVTPEGCPAGDRWSASP